MSGAEGLTTSPLLVGLAAGDMEALFDLAERRSYKPGDLIVEEGTASDCLFILAGGAVEVLRTADGTPVILAVLDEIGDFFGEMSLIDILPRSADIKAATDVEILAFPKGGLASFFTRSPVVQMTMILNISRNLSLRLRQADARIVELSSRLQSAGEGH